MNRPISTSTGPGVELLTELDSPPNGIQQLRRDRGRWARCLCRPNVGTPARPEPLKLGAHSSLPRGRVRQHQVDPARRILLHVRHDVRVSVERNRDWGVAKALADNLGVDVLPKKMSRVRVAEVMESNPRQTCLSD